MGDVIQFPAPAGAVGDPISNQRSCVDCKHALFGRTGTWCEFHRFEIADEVAEACGCEDYET